MHLTVHLEGLPQLAGEKIDEVIPTATRAPILRVTNPGGTMPTLPAAVQHISAVSGSAPELSDIQRERMEMLEMFNAPHNLPAAVFAEMAGKSRRWISYEIQAKRVLALSLGNRGQRVPNWHLDPLKHRLVQAVLKHSQDAGSWEIYRALLNPHRMLEDRTPIEAVTSANFHEAVMAACFTLKSSESSSPQRA